MAMYEMQESNLPNEEGKRILYPRIRLTGQDTLDDVAKYISLTSTFSPGDIKGAVQALVEAIAHSMGEGRSVKIDGLGIFLLCAGGFMAGGAIPKSLSEHKNKKNENQNNKQIKTSVAELRHPAVGRNGPESQLRLRHQAGTAATQTHPHRAVHSPAGRI